MTNLPERLRLKEMAEEDIYFARRDRELIEALRRRRRCAACAGEGDRRDSGPEAEGDSPGSDT